MALTVEDIAASAFSAVSGAISDAVHDATISGGSGNHTGRVVFGGENAPAGFPMPTAKDKMRPAYLEGFGVIPAPGWTLNKGSDLYYIAGVRDVVQAGSFSVVNVVAADDMLWQTASFQRKTGAVDAYGARIETWSAISGSNAVSVGLVALSGQERWQSQRLEATSQWRMWCEPIEGLTEADRVVIDGLAYAITFVNNIEQRGIWQVLDLSKGVPS